MNNLFEENVENKTYIKENSILKLDLEKKEAISEKEIRGVMGPEYDSYMTPM